MQKAVIYARYSSHAQRDVSIDQQIQACRKFADRHEIEIVDTYEDHALTGTNDKRPAFQRMIADARSGRWAYVIVYTLDRFARDRYDSAVYKRQLKTAGVRVLSAMENISDDPTGVLMEGMLESLAEYYSRELSRKISRGMADNASRCMVNGSLPLGYRRGEDGRYAIDEPEAALVREVFTRIADGEPFAGIIQDFNARGLRTKKGALWSHSSFNSMVSNERYCGVYIYGKTRVEGGIPAIIPRPLFERVQAALHRKGNPRRSPGAPVRRRREDSIYLLTGKLYCGHCRAPMVGMSGKSGADEPYYYYVCKNKRTGGSCPTHNVRRDWIEQYVATALRDLLLTDQAIATLADASVAYQQAHRNDGDLAALEQQLSDTQRSIDNLVRAIEAGVFSASTQARLDQLETEKQDLLHLITCAREEAEDILSREEIIAVLELFRRGDVSDPEYQEALINTFLVACYIYDDHLDFVFTLDHDQSTIPLPLDLSPDVRITSPSVHQTVLCEQSTTIYMVGALFAFRLQRNGGTR